MTQIPASPRRLRGLTQFGGMRASKMVLVAVAKEGANRQTADSRRDGRDGAIVKTSCKRNDEKNGENMKQWTESSFLEKQRESSNKRCGVIRMNAWLHNNGGSACITKVEVR
mmetsp:Transcript_29816/g.70211  ORF Transcript_29816/g.70211 Transcript_29816/m.70211 type:complete len:112 (+) Transcript_29816:1584-1919(+)